MIPVNILLAEHVLAIATDIRIRLIEFGFEVPAIISSGEEARKIAGIYRPDLVLIKKPL